ncbi:aminotransferase class IV [soil metagenome]
MSSSVYRNGEYLPRAEAHISVDERGFVFGEGVYEVTRALDGALYEADAHLERLERGLRGLEMDSRDGIDGAGLLRVSEQLLRDNNLLQGHASVYLQVTRGAAPRTHQFPPASTRPTVFLSASRFTPAAELHERGAAAITHPDVRWARCDLKTVNLLPNVLAKQHAVAAGATEAILIRDGVVTEGSHSNVFAVIDGELRTFPRCNYILAGITRGIVLSLAAELGIAASETPVLAGELADAEEIFLTGTTTDVMPIVRVDGLPIAGGQPGAATRALQEAHAERLRGVGALH